MKSFLVKFYRHLAIFYDHTDVYLTFMILNDLLNYATKFVANIMTTESKLTRESFSEFSFPGKSIARH